MDRERIAIGLFNHIIEQGQKAAIEEGLDKIDMMPYKSKWEEMGEDDKDSWRSEADAVIKIFEELGYTHQSRPRIAELHCRECGQYLPTPLTKHTFEDCQAYKVKTLKELGYTLPAEPAEDKVEAIARKVHLAVYQNGGELHDWENCKQEYYKGVALSILKLCQPELIEDEKAHIMRVLTREYGDERCSCCDEIIRKLGLAHGQKVRK